jgi:hypothetical protein
VVPKPTYLEDGSTHPIRAARDWWVGEHPVLLMRQPLLGEALLSIHPRILPVYPGRQRESLVRVEHAMEIIHIGSSPEELQQRWIVSS